MTPRELSIFDRAEMQHSDRFFGNAKAGRILLFTAALGYGGSEAALLRVARFLSREYDVTIALMSQGYGGTAYVDIQPEHGMATVLLAGGRREVSSFAKLIRWWRMFRQLRILKREHDATISFLSGPNFLNSLAGERRSTIVSERGSKLYHLGMSAWSKFLWLRVLDPITYRLAARIVPASAGYAGEVADVAGRHSAKKIVVIEGSIDADKMLDEATGAGDPDIINFANRFTIVYCGRLDKGKGLDHLVSVFAKVNREVPDARLLVIGDGPQKQALLDLCSSEGLSFTINGASSAAVFFAGYREAPIRHYKYCRVFAFPSLHEGLPNVLIEAVASGVAIVAADCPWGPRSILSGPADSPSNGIEIPIMMANGLLLPMIDTPEGHDTWTTTLLAELKQSPRRRSMEECRAAISRFDIQQTGQQWIQLIEDLLK